MFWLPAAVSFFLGAALVPRAAIERTPGLSRAEQSEGPAPSPVQWDSVAAVRRMAPFRTTRVAPAVRYTTGHVEAAAADEGSFGEPPPWRLTGIVRGVRPLALFEGVTGPGRGTWLLGEGEVLDEYVIERIAGDTVLVGRGEELWPFVFEAPWG